MTKSALLLIAATLLTVPMAFGGTIYWTDWTSADASHVYGTITLPSSTVVQVTYTGGYYFANLTPSTDYWRPNTYTGGIVGDAPDSLNTDIIGFGTGAGGSLTFSAAVEDPILAIVSMNGPTLTFSAAPVVQASGCGYWGCDTLTASGDTLVSTHGGEGHGTVEFQGDFSTLSFTESGSENWRGLTVGIVGLEPTANAPEPATLTLFGLGAAGLLRRLRARR